MDQSDTQPGGGELNVAATITGAGQVSSRSKTLQVRLSPQEYVAVERLAAKRGVPASTVARERLLNDIWVDAGTGWTAAQQGYALKAVEIVRAVLVSDDPAENIVAAALEIAKLIPGGVDATDAAFADVAPDIITGLVNMAGVLVEQSAAAGGRSADQVLESVADGVRSMNIVA